MTNDYKYAHFKYDNVLCTSRLLPAKIYNSLCSINLFEDYVFNYMNDVALI